MRTVTRLLLCCALTTAATETIAAEPSEAERRTAAEAIFTQASELMAKSDFVQACPKLEEVVKLQPNGIGARVTLADCYAGSGKLASAHATYGQAASMASLAGQEERAQAAQEKAAALAPRLSKLTINVSPELARLAGLSVMRGGMPVTSSLFNVPVPVDGGTYTVAAVADGRKPFTQSVKLPAEGGRISIELALGSTSSEGTVEQQPATTEPTTPPDAPGMPPVRIGGFVVGSIGVAMAAVGIAVGVTGVQAAEDANVAFDAAETQEQADRARSDYDDGIGQSTVGWVLAGIGGAATVAGVVMIVAAPSPKESNPTTVRLGPTLGGARLIATW